MNSRRQFLGSVAMVGSAAWIPIQKWLGNPAGGVFVPPPDDFLSVMDLTPWKQLDGSRRVGTESIVESQGALACIMWAAPGSSKGHFAFIGGDVPITDYEVAGCPWPKASPTLKRVNLDNLREKKTANLIKVMSEYAARVHEPGWLYLDHQRSGPAGWRRVDYLRWVKPSELAGTVVLNDDGDTFDYEQGPDVFDKPIEVPHAVL